MKTLQSHLTLNNCIGDFVVVNIIKNFIDGTATCFKQDYLTTNSLAWSSKLCSKLQTFVVKRNNNVRRTQRIC